MVLNRYTRFVLWSALLLLIAGPALAGIILGSSLLFLLGTFATIALLIGRVIMLTHNAGRSSLDEDWAARLNRWTDALAAQFKSRTLAAATPDISDGGVALPRAPAGLALHTLRDSATALSPAQMLAVVATLLAFALPVLLHTYQLATLQEEPYGDINIVFEYLDWIRAGLWPFSFVLSSGPLYHYLIYPVVQLLGQHYAALKIASVLTGFSTVFVTYLWARRLVNHGFALLAAFITGVSSWLLIFSRLGNSQILIPLITVTPLWLITHHLQTQQRRTLIAAATVAALGFYSYPQSFVIAPTFLITLVALKWLKHSISWRSIGLFALTSAAVAIPFLGMLLENPQDIISGYLTNKVAGIAEPLSRFLTNTEHALLAFHIRGDDVFRSNPAGLPHLDFISGVLLLLGIVFWLERPRRRWFPLLALPFFLLQLPSILVLNFPNEVPSASRTLGVAPLAYLLAASGAWFLYIRLAAHSALIARASLTALLALVLVLNAQRYFVDYINGLPYENTAIAKAISRHIDALPPDTSVYLYFCCWESGMPEPKSIHFELTNPREIYQLMPDGSLTCDTIDAVLKKPAVVFYDYHVSVPDPALATCPQRLSTQTYMSVDGHALYNLATLQPAPGSP